MLAHAIRNPGVLLDTVKNARWRWRWSFGRSSWSEVTGAT
jgi:hypothetical protein